MTIAYRHLRDPLRHSVKCGNQCASGCAVEALERALSDPVLASEFAADQDEEDRFKALAAEAAEARRQR